MADKVEQIRKAIARLRAASVPPTTVVRSTKGDKGDRGERGEKGTSFRWRGQVRKGMGFSPNDVVHYKGAAYLCLAVTTDPPPSDSWAVMCKARDGRDGRDGAQGAVGPQGEQGVQGPKGEAGADGLRWRGAYSQGQRYEIGDVVGYEGGAFVCVAATVQPPVTGAGWQVLAEAGKTGARGPKGERGADGTSASLADGDYGDITVSGSGLVWTIDDGTITPVKISTGGPQWTTSGTVTIDVGATANPNNALLIKSDNSGATGAPDLMLYRNSASPAVSDVLGRIRFKGNDEAANDDVYANIHAQIADPAEESISGQLHCVVAVEGVATERVKITEAAVATSTTAASVVVTGGIGVSGAAFVGGTGSVAGVLTAANTTESTSTTTGGLVCSGGIGVAKAVRVGSTTASTTSTTGALIVSGGGGFAKDCTVSGITVGTASATADNPDTCAALGKSALSGNTKDICVGVGQNAGLNNTGTQIVAIGYNALNGNTATSCMGIGPGALFSNTGSSCVGVGADALYDNDGTFCTAIGYFAGGDKNDGTANTLIGRQAGDVLTTGNHNVFIGNDAGGTATSADQNVILGSQSTVGTATDDNCIVIGYNRSGEGSNTTLINSTTTTQTKIDGTTSSTLIVSGQNLRLVTQRTIATTGTTGVKGDICHDADYIYVCTATNTWKRVAIATW